MTTRPVDATPVLSAVLTALSAVMVLAPPDHFARASAEEADLSFEAVSLRFRMNKAKIYGLDFE
ncbi:MAG TPA: hypothetical protein VMY37_17610 [Thermoguttaceae bacterium]|nr:hypothetical protein [Thermoguttaceae bacterium]